MCCQTQNQNMQSNFSELRRADRQSCWNTPLDRKATAKNLDKFLGYLVGGAAGDALGYAVEFLPEQAIFFDMGKKALQNIGFRMVLAGFRMTPR